MAEAETEKKTISFYEELGNANTALAYAGMALFTACFLGCLFLPFAPAFPCGAKGAAGLGAAVACGSVAVYFAVFASKGLTNALYQLHHKRQLAVPCLVVGLLYPVSLAAAPAIEAPYALLVALAVLFGAACAFFHTAWQLLSWYLTIWNFMRPLIVSASMAVAADLLLFASVPAWAAALCYPVFLVISALAFLAIGTGKRSEYIIERDDTVGHLFVFENRIDIAYFVLGMVGGASCGLLLMNFPERLPYALLAALGVLVVFAVAFGGRRHFSGKFLHAEIRMNICVTLMLLVLLMIPVPAVNVAALCLLVAGWICTWCFQGILMERVLGYGPTSLGIMNISNLVDTTAFLVGLTACTVTSHFVPDLPTLYLCLLVISAATLLAAVALLPVEAPSILEFPEGADDAAQQDAPPAPAAPVDSLASYVERRSEELVGTYKLSRREADVLRLLARGSSAKFIASQLGISDHTVRVHICHIYEKTGVHSKQSLMNLFDEN